jgi:hypothetical protein
MDEDISNDRDFMGKYPITTFFMRIHPNTPKRKVKKHHA